MNKNTFFALITISLISASTSIKAQVKYTVVASGMTFTPSVLNINPGDTVQWNNVSGFHNVNGTQATYPSNPESFGNGPASAPWTYTHVFNTVGTYNYHCDVHGTGMSGTINVQTGTAINELKNDKMVSVFPNPTREYFTISSTKSYLNVILYSVTGELVKTFKPAEKYFINDLSKGIYILSVEMDANNKFEDKLIIE